MKLLIVVHRVGYPGGSERHCEILAKAAAERNHEVTILTDTYIQFDSRIHITTDRNIAFSDWDMIIVHGSMTTQDFVLFTSKTIKSPIYYLLVQPTDSQISQYGMQNAKWIGWGTTADLMHIEKYKYTDKGHQYFYPIDTNAIGDNGFKQQYDITTKNMYLSVGGFWPHKRMNELSEEFQKANIDNCTLVLMGYDTRFGQPPMQSKNIRIFVGADQQTIFNAMRESDLYILNSDNEGYGLVLLESMLNGCEWIGRDIAAAHDLHTYYALGNTYKTKEELQILLKSFLKNENAIKAGKSFVTTTHNAERSVICLEQCL